MNRLQKQWISCSKIPLRPSPRPCNKKALSLFCDTGCYKKTEYFQSFEVLQEGFLEKFSSRLGTMFYRNVTCLQKPVLILYFTTYVPRLWQCNQWKYMNFHRYCWPCKRGILMMSALIIMAPSKIPVFSITLIYFNLFFFIIFYFFTIKTKYLFSTIFSIAWYSKERVRL